ncbi:MAG: NUDIX domain-containing protein [Nanoarchaeota archaeon]|nr:NUDIX domain-containing protein [Nanoarchaeota archaeon]
MEKNILELFLFDNKLKFNEIVKALNQRSNKIAYHLKKLIKKQILIKENETYSLSKTSEKLIPYLSDKKSTLPIILIHLGNEKQCLLYKRKKRPFKDILSLPGGRLLIKESIQQATKRILKEKHNIKSKLKKVNSVSLEHVKNKNKKVHSFLLIFVTVTSKDKISLTNIKENKSKIISSDYKLLKKDLDKEIKIQTLISET